MPLPLPTKTFTAWQLIGWESICGDLMVEGGRATYTDVMYNCITSKKYERVKLARLDPGPREVCQWVEADQPLTITRITREGWNFLIFQDLVVDSEVPEAPLLEAYRLKYENKS